MNNENVIELLDQLYNEGKLQMLVDSGCVNSNVLMWRNVIHAYRFRLEATKSKMQSMQEVAENFEISIEMVRYIRKKLEPVNQNKTKIKPNTNLSIT